MSSFRVMRACYTTLDSVAAARDTVFVRMPRIVTSHRNAFVPCIALALVPACEGRTTAASNAPAPATSTLASAAKAPAAKPSSSALRPVDVCPKRKGPSKIAWTNESHDLVLDEAVLRCLSDAERAAVAFVSTTLGTECDWISGTDLSAPEHMDCKLTTALGLGYQCEAKHKSFLVDWLANEIPDRCARIPTTAFSQSVLTDLSLKTEAPTITVDFRAVSTTGPGGTTRAWSETIVFEEKNSRGLLIRQRAEKR